MQFDLLALAEDLRSCGLHKDLVNSIERAAATASAHEDLKEARACLTLLKKLTKVGRQELGMPEDELSTTAGALFSQSIILYARATDTPPIERRKWFGSGKLDPADRATHRIAIDLRDKAVAHFGKARDLQGGPLVREALVLRTVDRDLAVAFYSLRAQNRSVIATRLLRLAGTVLGMAESATLARYQDVGKNLARATALDPSLPTRARRYPFVPSDFFISEGAQAEMDQYAGPTGTHTLHSSLEVPDE